MTMTVAEAILFLQQEKCVEEYLAGWRIVRSPKRKKDFDLFILAIKTLSVWSISTVASNARVKIETGAEPNSLIFKVYE